MKTTKRVYEMWATAYVLVMVVRALWRGNKDTMDERRWKAVPSELGANVVAMVERSTSVTEFFSEVMERFGWQGMNELGWPLRVYIDMEQAKELGLPLVPTKETGDSQMAWLDAIKHLDIIDVRDFLRTNGPVFAALVADRETSMDVYASFTSLPKNKVPTPPSGRSVGPRNYIALATALSPIAHGDFDRGGGNITPLRREKIWSRGIQDWAMVPMLSAASLRGQFRRHAVDAMLVELGLRKTDCDPEVINSLLSGGSLDAGAAPPAIPVERRRNLRDLCPFVDLFGGTFNNNLMEGKLKMGDGLPVCAETMDHLDAVALKLMPCESPASCEVMTVSRTGTRHPDEDVGDGGDRMIFATEAFVAGVTLMITLRLDKEASIAPATLGALSWALADWQNEARLGAKGNAGFGSVEWHEFRLQGTEETLAERFPAELFLNHIREPDRRERLIKWLKTGDDGHGAAPAAEPKVKAGDKAKAAKKAKAEAKADADAKASEESAAPPTLFGEDA